MRSLTPSALLWFGYAVLGQADSTLDMRGVQHFDYDFLHAWARGIEQSSHTDSFDGTGYKLEGIYTMDHPKYRSATLAQFNLTEAMVDSHNIEYDAQRLHARQLTKRLPAPGQCDRPICGTQAYRFESLTEQEYMSGQECEFISGIAAGTSAVAGFVFSNAGCNLINERAPATKTVCKFLIELSTATGGYFIGGAVKKDCQDHMINIANSCQKLGGRQTCTEPTGSAFTIRKFIYGSAGTLCSPNATTQCRSKYCTNGDCKGDTSP